MAEVPAADCGRVGTMPPLSGTSRYLPGTCQAWPLTQKQAPSPQLHFSAAVGLVLVSVGLQTQHYKDFCLIQGPVKRNLPFWNHRWRIVTTTVWGILRPNNQQPHIGHKDPLPTLDMQLNSGQYYRHLIFNKMSLKFCAVHVTIKIGKMPENRL